MPWRQRTSIPPKQVLTCTVYFVQHKEFELALAWLASSFAQRPSFSRSKSSDVERSLFCLELWFIFFCFFSNNEWSFFSNHSFIVALLSMRLYLLILLRSFFSDLHLFRRFFILLSVTKRLTKQDSKERNKKMYTRRCHSN